MGMQLISGTREYGQEWVKNGHMYLVEKKIQKKWLLLLALTVAFHVPIPILAIHSLST